MSGVRQYDIVGKDEAMESLVTLYFVNSTSTFRAGAVDVAAVAMVDVKGVRNLDSVYTANFLGNATFAFCLHLTCNKWTKASIFGHWGSHINILMQRCATTISVSGWPNRSLIK